ncbi:unnamed protein product [Gordionus sp. m RMFG-2023]
MSEDDNGDASHETVKIFSSNLDRHRKNEFATYVKQYFERYKKVITPSADEFGLTSEAEHDWSDMVNECVKATNTCLIDETKIPQNVEEILKDRKCGLEYLSRKTVNLVRHETETLSQTGIKNVEGPNAEKGASLSSREYHRDNYKFWCLAYTLKLFIDKYGKLPLRGILPDMNCDTEIYVEILTLFRRRFAEECLQFKEIWEREVLEILDTSSPSAEIGCSSSLKIHITDQEIELFCKNCHFLRVVRGLPAENEVSALFDSMLSPLPDQEISENVSALSPKDLSLIYCLIRCYSKFASEIKEQPIVAYKGGANEMRNIKTLKECVRNFVEDRCSPGQAQELRELIDAERTEALMKEMLKHYESLELITTCSFLGGIASQQCVKVLTRQYVPFKGTFIYSGIDGSNAQFS